MTAPEPAVVRGSWLDHATSQLAAAGVPTPRVDAELLAVDGMGVPRHGLASLPDPGEQYWALVERRCRREPLQHIIGRAWFRYVDVAVGPGVFVPRPETELVAGAAVEEARERVRQGVRPQVVDLGTGSGVIALSVATEVPQAHVHAVERDPDALRWSERNLASTGVQLHAVDLADAWRLVPAGVDVVVSNPPYIPPDGVPVDPEVRLHDPSAALYGTGADGLGEVRAVIATAARCLRTGGLLVVEHADVQADVVLALLDDGWVDVRSHRDLAGRARYVTARLAEDA
jgi:release factor glutamine methyltransferase